jgi:UDP-2,3-diacylglucosamine pyrophosphatase LpxH
METYNNRPIHFTYRKLRRKILHVDNMVTTEIVFDWVSQLEEKRYFKMVEETRYIIIKLNLWGNIEKIAYVHSRCFVYFSAQTTDFNNH